MKRPACRDSSAAICKETQEQQDDTSWYNMEQQGGGLGVHGAVAERNDVVAGGGYEEEEDEEELAGGRGGLGEQKRRLAADQVRALERCFEVDNKLDPERKARIARDLRLHPRQVAVWFQNRRARWKTKQIERDFATLRARHDALRHECDELRRDKDALAAEIIREELKDPLEGSEVLSAGGQEDHYVIRVEGGPRSDGSVTQALQ